MTSSQDPPIDATQPLPSTAPIAEELFDRRYRILRTIGEGGCGRVLLVEDVLHLGEKLALKVILPKQAATPEFERRFRNEIRVLRALTHPAIPQIYNDGKTEEGEFYYSMAFVEGRTLEDVLRESGPMDPERIVRVVKQVLTVLDYAHAHGVVHRDLKPQNIMLVRAGSEDEEVKVLDFGIAKVLAAVGPLEHMLTQETSLPIGTPHYMSPEQVRGKEVDARTDLYALGIIIYRMVSGELPFGGKTLMEILTARLDHDPLPLTGHPVPAWLGQLVMSLLAREKEKRPSTQQIQAQLDGLGRGQWKLQRKQTWTLAASAAALVLVGWLLVTTTAVKGSEQKKGEEQRVVQPDPSPAPPSPSASIDEPTEGSYHAGALTVRGNAKHVERVLVEGREVEVDPDGTFEATLELESGEHTIRILNPGAAAGGSSLAERTVIIDNDEPDLTLTQEGSPLADGSYLVRRANPWLRVVVRDSPPGYVKQVKVADSVIIPNETGAFETKTVLGQGRTEIAVEAVDMAGNANLKTIVWVLDDADPIITVSQPSESRTTEPQATLEVHVEDEHKESLRLDGRELARGQGRYLVDVLLKPGSNEFLLVAEDAAGNQSVPVRITIVRETPETGPIVQESPRVVLPPGFVAVGDAVDAISGRPLSIRPERSDIDLVYVGAGGSVAKPFYIGRTEVTRAQWERGGGSAPAAPSFATDTNHPVISISWKDARDFCQRLGMDLPTRDEWLYAACGPQGRVYPWGNEWQPGSSHVPEGGAAALPGTAAVGSYSPRGDSWCGAADLAGNVSEWCTDAAGADALLFGSSWRTKASAAQSADDKPATVQKLSSTIGFRPVLRISD